jgi:putative flippase GtrA
MRNIFETIGSWISIAIDFFYPPFGNYMTLQFFRYGVSGVANMAFDLVLYFLVYNFVLQHQMLHLGFVTLSSHIATLAIIFPISSFTGFLLQKYVTFTASDLRGHVQLYRYFIVVFINLMLNYVGLKLLVDGLHFFPTPAKMTITFFTTLFSYFSQKKFTFKNV